MLDPNDAIHNRAQHILRSAWSCTLLYDQSPFESQCMIDPRSGDFIIAVVKDAFDATDITIASPKDSFDTRVRISVELFETTTEEQRDRFTAYHLPSTTPLLAIGKFQYAKIDSGEVVTPEQCELRNPVLSVMGPLCKALNADRSRLSSLCSMITGVAHDSPLAVGVDDTGIDIRARFGLVRLILPDPITDPDSAMGTIEQLLESADA
ncbi:MAG: hypothetical protein P1U30_04315 [Phycisphaerales bacterium]|nr:hypothetical protein [Phycisphaerales bacterium]